MTPLSAPAANTRFSGPASGTGMVVLAESAPLSVRRAQPVEKIQAVSFQTQGRQTHQSRKQREETALKLLAPETQEKRSPRNSSERLPPAAKFGNSMPVMAQLMAHESGHLRAFMRHELSGFTRELPTKAYQETLDRSRYFMMERPPLHVAA
jgi:hypothetical protein